MTSSHPRYSRSDILSLRNNFPIPRRLRRRLWYYKLLQPYSSASTSRVDCPVVASSLKSNSTSQTSSSPTLRKPQQHFPAPSILLFNARSLLNKLDDLKVRVAKFDPDVVVITETWLDNSVREGVLTIQGYKVFRNDRDLRGGGVAIFCKTALTAVVESSPTISKINSNLLSLRIADFDASIIVIYHPYWGNGSSHDFLLNVIQEMFDSCVSTHQLLVGDVNDLRHFLPPFLLCNNMNQIVTRPTRGQNILDIIATNHAEKFESPVYLSPLGRSDHKGIFLKSTVHKPVTTTKVTFRILTPSSYAACCKFLSFVNWNDLLFFDDVDVLVEHFQNFLLFLFQTFCEQRTVRMRSCDPPWISPALKALSDDRDRALSRGNYQKYLVLREKFTSEVGKAKVSYFARVSSASYSEKWKFINSQVKVPNSSKSFDFDEALKLNDIFHSSFSPPDIQHFRDDRTPDGKLSTTPATDYFVSEREVFLMIQQCKSNSVGCDGVPGFFIRSLAVFLSLPLSIIYNRCLDSAVFPRIWKCANITPIPKKDSKDFRPISILPFLSKILERLVRDKVIIPSLKKSLDTRQFGFVRNGFGGCTNALLSIRLSLLEHITSASKKSACLLAVDYRKAFDSLSHRKLLESLIDNFNCSFQAIRIVQSFLSERFQRVFVNGFSTPWLEISSGVPQGSIIGPLLFTLFLNDLPTFDDTHIVAYADDVTIIFLDNDWSQFQNIVDEFSFWSSNKGLQINVDKTKCMYVSRNVVDTSSLDDLLIDGSVVDIVDHVKILGMIFSADLRWDRQFSLLYRKCCSAMSCVKKVKTTCCNGNIVWQAFMGLVYCHLTYSWPIICDLNQNHFKKLERMYNLATRWSNHLDEPRLRDRLDKTCHKLVNKIAANVDIHPLSQFFVTRNNPHLVRHSRVLLPLKRSNAMYRNSFVKFCKCT